MRTRSTTRPVRHRTRGWIWAAVVAALAFAPAAEARERIDVIELVKGDRVTGEIVQLESGILTVRTLVFGTVDIEWSDVVALVSVQLFDLERSDGVRFTGHLDEGERPGTLLLRRSDEDLLEIPLSKVFSVRQLGSSIWKSRRGRLNLGLDYTHANDDSKFSLDAELTFQGRRFRFKNTMTSSISDDAGNDQRERTDAESQFEIPAGTRFVWQARGSWERNDELDLDSRITAGATLMWIPWRSAGGRFGVGAGLVESEERYRGEDTGHAVTGAVVMVGGEYHRFGAYGSVASFELAYVSMLSESDRYRLEASASLSQKIARNFNISVSPYYSFDSRPPRETLNDEDWGWISSLGWRF